MQNIDPELLKNIDMEKLLGDFQGAKKHLELQPEKKELNEGTVALPMKPLTYKQRIEKKAVRK